MIDEMPDVRLYRLYHRGIWVVPTDLEIFQRYADGIGDDVRK